MRGLGVEADERLVHDYELRVVQPRGNYRELLLHAVRVRSNGLCEIVGQLEDIGVSANALLTRVGADAEYVGHKVEVLYAAHVVVKVGVIRYVGKLFLAGERVKLYGHAADVYLAGIKLLNTDDGFQRRGLARAVMAYEAVYFPRSDVKRKIVHRFFLPECFCEMLYT